MIFILLFSMESCWICVKVGYWNLILHVIVVCSVLSVNTGTEPKVPIPNFLGTEFLQEPIGTDLLRNRICMGTEEPNRSVRYYRMPRVSGSSNGHCLGRKTGRAGTRAVFRSGPSTSLKLYVTRLGELNPAQKNSCVVDLFGNKKKMNFVVKY